jgi:Ca2+-binding EF-hand superfamily protein
LFDEDRSNSIEENELIAILKANHMAGDPSAVQRKAQTIMRQADNDGDGCITLEEFHVIAMKFPNVSGPLWLGHSFPRPLALKCLCA